jgi:hypothetical protein
MSETWLSCLRNFPLEPNVRKARKSGGEGEIYCVRET